MPDEIPEVTLKSDDGQLGIAHLLKGAGLVSSTSEAFRMIKQGAVKIDGDPRRRPIVNDRRRQQLTFIRSANASLLVCSLNRRKLSARSASKQTMDKKKTVLLALLVMIAVADMGRRL